MGRLDINPGPPPPAPPPLPPPMIISSTKTSNGSTKLTQFPLLNVDPETVKAIVYERVRISSREDRVPVATEENFFYYANIDTELQVGPTCGLLALSLLSKFVQPMRVEDILRLATERNLTTHGEMFKAKDLCSLTQEVLGDYCDVQLRKNCLSTENMWDDIRSGVFYLVPYDKDKNNSPGLFQGHRAHWCIIIGSCLWNSNRFFCAVEGTSLKVALWPVCQLAASNESLVKVNPELVESGFHSCSLGEELAGYSIRVLFKRLQLEYITGNSSLFCGSLQGL